MSVYPLSRGSIWEQTGDHQFGRQRTRTVFYYLAGIVTARAGECSARYKQSWYSVTQVKLPATTPA